MSSQSSFSSGMLFQTINDDLNASLATADELSREFNSMLKEASSSSSSSSPQYTTTPGTQAPPPSVPSWSSDSSGSSFTFSPSSASFPSSDAVFSSSNRSAPSTPTVITSSPSPSPGLQRAESPLSPSLRQSPKASPHTPRRRSPSPFDRSPRGSASYLDRSPSPTPLSPGVNANAAAAAAANAAAAALQSPNRLSPYDTMTTGRRSPRHDRSRSPLSFNRTAASTLPRNFNEFRQQDESMQRQKSPGRWNETDLDVTYEKKPHHSYDSQ